MTNKINTVLYTGITGDLIKRVYEHKQKMVEGFTKKYTINKLVYYEILKLPAVPKHRDKRKTDKSRFKKKEDWFD